MSILAEPESMFHRKYLGKEVKRINAIIRKELTQKATSNQRLFSPRHEPILEVITPNTEPQNNVGIFSQKLVIKSDT